MTLKRSSRRLHSGRGFTLSELMVGMFLLSFLGMTIAAFSKDVLHRAGLQTNLSLASMELRNALDVMSAELRGSASISPYLVGNNAATVTCTSNLSVSSTSVKFLVVEDDSTSSTSGLKPYYVGYSYDSTKRQLLRGEIAAPSVTACSLPAGDPTSTTYAKVIASDVNQIDADGNGSLDPVFSLSGNQLSVNLGLAVNPKEKSSKTFKQGTKIYVRIHS